MEIQDLKDFLLKWNNLFPFDRRFRKKYSIAFNSPEHRSTNQIDVFLDFLEDKLANDATLKHKERQERLEDYKKGRILQERDLDVGSVYDDLDVTKFNE